MRPLVCLIVLTRSNLFLETTAMANSAIALFAITPMFLKIDWPSQSRYQLLYLGIIFCFIFLGWSKSDKRPNAMTH